MQLKHRIFLSGAVCALLVASMQACAEPAGGEDAPDAAADTNSGPADTGATDTGVKDAGKDTSVRDTGVPDTFVADTGPTDPTRPGDPFDPLAPKEGDSCTPNNAFIERSCGMCGIQKALCTNGKLEAYGACLNAKSGSNPAGKPYCLPNAVERGSCGLCGTAVKTCDPTSCLWDEGTCDNEVVDGCVPGQVTYVAGACANPTDVRKQTCSAQCALGAPEQCAPEPIDTLNIPTDGSTTSAPFAFRSDFETRPGTGTCPVTVGTSKSAFHPVLLKNTTPNEVVIETWPSTPAGGSSIDTVSTAYVGATTRPRTDAEKKACSNYSNDTCSSSPCASSWSGLAKSEAVTIPVKGTAVILTSVFGTSTNAGKPYIFNVRVQPPPPPPPPAPPPVSIPATVGAQATYPIDLGSSRTSPNTDSACPSTLSSRSPVYNFVTVNNPTAQTAKVEVWDSSSTTDTIMASYASAPPVANLAQCLTAVNDTCGTSVTGQACLVGANALTIPAGGSVTVYFAAYSSTAAQTLNLTFKTTALN